MTGTIWVAVIVVVVALGLFAFRAIPGLRAYFGYRGKRLITCPETHKAAAVEVAAGEASVGAFLSEPTLRLKECSRWPERQDCGQECLQQIEVSPENCLVWNIVSTWYEGKQCVFCHKTLSGLHHLDHAPALLSPDQQIGRVERTAPRAIARRIFHAPAGLLELSRDRNVSASSS